MDHEPVICSLNFMRQQQTLVDLMMLVVLLASDWVLIKISKWVHLLVKTGSTWYSSCKCTVKAEGNAGEHTASLCWSSSREQHDFGIQVKLVKRKKGRRLIQKVQEVSLPVFHGSVSDVFTEGVWENFFVVICDWSVFFFFFPFVFYSGTGKVAPSEICCFCSLRTKQLLCWK